MGSKLEARLVGGAKYANMHPDKLMDVLTGLRTTVRGCREQTELHIDVRGSLSWRRRRKSCRVSSVACPGRLLALPKVSETVLAARCRLKRSSW